MAQHSKSHNALAALEAILYLCFLHARKTYRGSGRRQFSLADIKALNLQVAHLTRSIAPLSSTSLLAQFRQQNTQTQIQGVDSAYFIATNWEITSGKGFELEDYRTGNNVCIIGKSVQKNLFDKTSTNPLGATIRLNHIVCKCIGVLEEKGQGAMGNDQDDVILLPLKTYQRSISKSNSVYNISRIIISSQKCYRFYTSHH